MAALLDRGEGIVPGNKTLEAKGVITAIDATTRKVTLKQDTETREVVVAAEALVYVGNKTEAGAFTDLAVGQTVKMVLNSEGLAVVVTAKSEETTTNPTNPPTGAQVTGIISAIATSANGTSITVRGANQVESTYPLAANATLTSNGVAITVAQLQNGMKVTVTVTNGQITALTVGQ